MLQRKPTILDEGQVLQKNAQERDTRLPNAMLDMSTEVS